MGSIYLAKGRNSLKYDREVMKIEEVISYMGGLLSALVALLFMLNSYTDTAF